jgi:hypothetical protein
MLEYLKEAICYAKPLAQVRNGIPNGTVAGQPTLIDAAIDRLSDSPLRFALTKGRSRESSDD